MYSLKETTNGKSAFNLEMELSTPTKYSSIFLIPNEVF